MAPFQEKISTIRQVATNTGRIAAGNPESPLPVDGLEQRQNNKPELPSLQHYGWRMDQEQWVTVMTNMPPAP